MVPAPGGKNEVAPAGARNTGKRDELVLVEKSRHRRGTAAKRRPGLPTMAACLLFSAPFFCGFAQSPDNTPAAAQPPLRAVQEPATAGLGAWTGLKVAAVQFRGVGRDVVEPLPAKLELQAGQPLDARKLRESLRRLYATGLYRTIQVEGIREGDEVTIIFTGEPRVFVGRVYVDGVKNDRLSTQIGRAAKLEAGTAFSEARLEHANDLIRAYLKENGYYQPLISSSTKFDAPNAQIDIHYKVDIGPDARVGQVAVEGDSGLTLDQFRKKAKLKQESKVNRDTTNRAWTGCARSTRSSAGSNQT